MQDLCSITFQDITSIPGPVSVQVPSNISIYGIKMIVKRVNIRIDQSKEPEEKQEMTASMKLKEFGFLGTLPPDEPEKLTLFYDYDYPLMDSPIEFAEDCSVHSFRVQCTVDRNTRVICKEITGCA